MPSLNWVRVSRTPANCSYRVAEAAPAEPAVPAEGEEIKKESMKNMSSDKDKVRERPVGGPAVVRRLRVRFGAVGKAVGGETLGILPVAASPNMLFP